MKKNNKKQKNIKKKASPKKGVVKKVVKKVSKTKIKAKAKPKAIKKPAVKNTKKKVDEVIKIERLVTRGKERGFVTYDEILREFPTIETDIMLLDELYAKFSNLNIDVLEGGGLLEIGGEPEAKGKYSLSRSDSSYDSIQMYLREIGQYPLIAGSMEKELAKRIEK
jgi:RNA polymerase primary sigma factor